MIRLAIISDTHLPRGRRRLPDACVERLRAADLILHAGDLSTVVVLDDLQAIGPPVHAVIGNVDEVALLQRLPLRTIVDVAGVRIGMLHDAGPAQGRLARQRANFPGCDAVSSAILTSLCMRSPATARFSSSTLGARRTGVARRSTRWAKASSRRAL